MRPRKAPTNPVPAAVQSPWIHYHRQLSGADFSLQASTAAVPGDGHFYLLQQDSVVMRSEDFLEAEAAYRSLCRKHWEEHLNCEDPASRVASAWGLLGLEPGNPAASAVIEQDGRPEDRARLAKQKQRRRF